MVPSDSSLDEGIVLEVEAFKFLGRWWEDLVLAEPAKKVRILMKAVRVEELVENYTFGRQTMVAVILIVLVAIPIDPDPLPPESSVFLLYIEPSEPGLLPTHLSYTPFEPRKQLFFELVFYLAHYIYIFIV